MASPSGDRAAALGGAFVKALSAFESEKKTEMLEKLGLAEKPAETTSADLDDSQNEAAFLKLLEAMAPQDDVSKLRLQEQVAETWSAKKVLEEKVLEALGPQAQKVLDCIKAA